MFKSWSTKFMLRIHSGAPIYSTVQLTMAEYLIKYRPCSGLYIDNTTAPHNPYTKINGIKEGGLAM